ncbi:unnamed protein product [Phytophthora lilii]|uniref:Unnamed protein product n=1 Tax=Phytophthora lilii TaxID=2077276 RepID=A0A9W6TFU3_9STRA|nr:unnamed protein product [Phytophthora lilii]
MTTDNILSQLDAVTTLDGCTSTEKPADAEGGEDESLSSESGFPQQVSPLSGEDVVRAVLDLATNADNENTSEDKGENDTALSERVPVSQGSSHDGGGGPSGIDETEHLAEVPSANDIENGSVKILDEADPPTAYLGEAEEEEIVREDIPTAQCAYDDVDPPTTLPPPVPMSVPVIVGSMNPVEDDNDDSDESQGEEDNEKTQLPPPLHLNDQDDDDEDVLEVDAAVVTSLQIEAKQRLSKQALSTEQQPVAANQKIDRTAAEENALLKALPGINVKDKSGIELSFGDEVRVAHVTTLEPSSPFSDIHKMAGGSNSSKFGAETAFGISYQSMRKKIDEAPGDADQVGYSVPSGPAFPDEREFENEMEMASDLSFSVAATVATSPDQEGSATANADDDEFAFDAKPQAELNTLSEDVLRARRESLEAQKLKEEEELLKELKRATDEEKRLIESNRIAETDQTGLTTAVSTEAQIDPDALSLTELHSIYKRGLGDQEVLLDENDENNDSAKATGDDRGRGVGRSTSVMGRILSQTQGATETIAEEADGDNSDGEENATNGDSYDNHNAVDDIGEDAKTITEKSDVDEASEWREIQLVQHRQSQNPPGAGSSSKLGNSLEAVPVSRITYAEAAGYFAETPEIMQHRDIIVSEDIPRGSCLTCLSRPRLTFAGAIEERDRVFCIAATAFDAHNDVVIGILQTIYRKVTKSPRDVLLIGRHWEDIGFQGTDPSTDLRGCGVLSLLQMLHLVEAYPDLAHRFYALSQHPTRHFPFACVLINITLQCVVALRAGALYPECNKHASVLTGMNRLHVALTSLLHDAIQSRSDEIPVIMKDVLDRGRSNPSKAIDEAFDGSALRPSRPAALATTSSKTKATERKTSDNNLEFTEIGLHSVDEE